MDKTPSSIPVKSSKIIETKQIVFIICKEEVEVKHTNWTSFNKVDL